MDLPVPEENANVGATICICGVDACRMPNEIDRELKEAVTAIVCFWRYLLYGKYFLFICMDESLQGACNLLFGNMKSARITPAPKGDTYSDIPLGSFLNAIENGMFLSSRDNTIAIKKIGFISKDLIYALSIQESEGVLSFIMAIDNMTYGRGSMNNYIIARCKNGLWTLSSSSPYTHRTARYDGVSGDMAHCVNFVFRNENEQEHPYQSMIEMFRWKYKETQSSILEINTTNGCLGFNGCPWFYI